jgi:DNA-binding NtrC family response regulator
MKKKNKFIIAGEEILEYLMKINPDVKVILASGYDMNEKIKGMTQKGCKEFVQKPYDIGVVSMKI